MRIGPVDMSLSALFHLAILVACLIALPVLYLRKWPTVREAWCSGPVNDALAHVSDKEGALEKGIGYARTLVSVAPARVTARMSLACLLARAQEYKEAREVFEQAAALSGITPEEKSQALTGAACSAALDGGLDRLPKNLDVAEKLAISALAAKDTPDALAAMALIESWKPDANDAFLAGRIDKAFKAPGAIAPGLLEQLYFLQGILAVHSHALADATSAFERVNAVNPDNATIADYQHHVLLAGLTDPALSPTERRDLLTRTNSTLGKMGKNRNEAYFSIALAWLSLNGKLNEPGVNPLQKAEEAFMAVIGGNPRDRRATEGQIKIKESKIADYLKEVKVPVPGLTGEQTELSEWQKQYATLTAVTPEQTRIGGTLRKIETELFLIDTLWKDYLEKASPPEKERAEVMLRRIALRRQCAWLAPRDARRDRLKDAQTLAVELGAFDHSGAAEYVQGLIAIDLDEYARALKLFQTAGKAGYKAPELDKLLALLTRPPAYKDFGPRPNERSFGANPMARAILDTPLSVGGLHDQTFLLKGKPVKATVVGTQLYYLPTAAELTGPNTFRAMALDATDQPLEFPQFHLRIDRDPPDWTLDPLPGPAVATQIWTVSLTDATGVDWHTLHAGVRPGKVRTALDIVLVKDGRYTRSIAPAGIKVGIPIEGSPFTLAMPSPMPPGDYQVFIEVSDTLGNKLKDQKNYTVK